MNPSKLGISWYKSSYSSPNGGQCLEVGKGLSGVVPLRDSKRPDGPVVVVSPRAWAGLVALAREANL
ncbi:DUF397 domain-containing protein [Streptomyces sp. NPDC020875]|uniref:DUF397 domain-containing protein n=1 Tax=Streptomyces sp. NPDC020875 TaxID=3154898 RepID=UPI0033E08461